MLYSNNQWIVTEDALQTLPSEAPYVIEISRLTETTERHDGVYYDWPLHMAEKTWVRLPEFLDAFCKALEIHRGLYSPPVDVAMLEASLTVAHQLR